MSPSRTSTPRGRSMRQPSKDIAHAAAVIREVLAVGLNAPNMSKKQSHPSRRMTYSLPRESASPCRHLHHSHSCDLWVRYGGRHGINKLSSQNLLKYPNHVASGFPSVDSRRVLHSHEWQPGPSIANQSGNLGHAIQVTPK